MYAKLYENAIKIYPYTLTQLQQDNPNTSFTRTPTIDELYQFEVVFITQTDIPKIDYTQNVTESIPVLKDSTWYQTWVVSQVTEQEISDRLALKSFEIRNQRNSLLSQSDWTQVLDSPVDRQVWSTYRQALRDITNQPGFPLEVTWPQQPE